MTKDEALKVLCTEEAQNRIKNETEIHGASRLSHYAAFSDGIYDNFLEINEKWVAKLLDTYRPPSVTDDNFNVVTDFIVKYTRSTYFSGSCQEAIRRYRVGFSHFYGRDEDYEERQMMYANPESRILGELTEKFAAQITREFRKSYIHTASDTVLFVALSNGNTIEQIARVVYPESKFTQSVENKIRYRVNLMHFRLACYALSQGWGYGEQFGLKMLKLYPKQFKQFFGDAKSFPTKEQLLFAAHGDRDWKPTEPKLVESKLVRSTPTHYSFVDFNGVKHRKYAVAYYKDGSSYDFVNKVRRVPT